MESELPQTNNKKIPFTKTHFIVSISIVVLLIGVGMYYHQQKTAKHTVLSDTTTKQKKADLNMLKQSPAPLTNKQKKQLAEGTATATKDKVFYITAGNFYFTPNRITVNQGDHVSIVLSNRDGFHDFVIDALHVRMPVIRQGQFTTARFTADKKGTYEFYCSLPGHKEQGMKGTLIVQ